MSGIDEILAGSESLQAGQEAPCKDLHRHPELSHHEHRTARCVGGELGKYGFTVQTGIGGTGVAGVRTNGAGPTVLLRAKLDALPVRENTGVDYASTVTMAADGQGMVDGLLKRIPAPDGALAQHEVVPTSPLARRRTVRVERRAGTDRPAGPSVVDQSREVETYVQRN